MTPDTENSLPWTTTLIALLERQHTLVTSLAELAQSQATLIEERRTDALLGLLSRRQRLIDEFSSSQEQLADLTGDLAARIETIEPVIRKQIQSLIADIGTQLANVLQCDGKDQQMLATARGETAAELSGLDAGRNARNAYRDSGSPDSRFADRTG